MDIKSRILHQATQMFFKYGIRSITMDEVAESLGMSKRTLYESFSNKEELLTKCIEYQYQEGLQIRKEIVAKHADDPLEILRQNFRVALITLNNIHPNFFNDLQKYYWKVRDRHVNEKQQENIEFTQSIIEKGMEKGVFRKDLNSNILSIMIHSVMQIINSPDEFPESRFPRAEVFRQSFLNFIRGMATEEGLKLIDEKFQ